jgi:hypothetical protein
MPLVNRRVLLLIPAAAGTAGLHRVALAQLKKVDEAEPKATAIGYRHDSAKVDKARYSKHDVNHRCHNCLAFAPDKPTDEWGECDLMSDRLVHRNGWCSSYKPVKAKK